MNKLITNTAAFFTSFKKDERGVTAIEYGLIGVAMAALLAIVFATEGHLITNLSAAFDSISHNISISTPEVGTPEQ